MAKPRKILIVDDQELMRRLFRMALEKQGFAVVLAENGLEGVAMAEIESPDLILMDLDMPKLGGFEAIRRIRERRPIPIIVFTAHATQTNIARALEAGAADFIVKSEVQIGSLLEKIERACKTAKPVAPVRKKKRAPRLEAPSIAPEQVAAKLGKIVELKALPFVAAEIIQVTANPGYDMTVLTETIERDQALTARVLQIANSAFYAMHGRVQNLTQAVTRLGSRGVREMALAVALVQEYPSRGARGGLDRVEFWKHSLACAVLAKDLAPAVGLAEPEIAFVAGLLHDVGKAVLDDHLHEEYATVLAATARRGAALHDVEAEMLGVDHAVLSRRLLERWRLPDEFTEPIVQHHDVQESGKGDRRLVGLVRIANVLAKAARVGWSGDETIEEIPDSLALSLRLTAAAVREAVDRLDRQVQELTQILLLHGGSAGSARKPAAGPPRRAVLVGERQPIVDPVALLLSRLDCATAPGGSSPDVAVFRPMAPDRLGAELAKFDGSTRCVVLADGTVPPNLVKSKSVVVVRRPFYIPKIEKALG